MVGGTPGRVERCHARRAAVWQERENGRLAPPPPPGNHNGMPRPRVSTNLAVSADGKITSVRGIPSGWTSAEDHRRFLELRRGADALLAGRGTLDADRMTMTAPGSAVPPLRCVVSRRGNLDPQHPLFRTPGGAIHLLVTESSAEIPPEIASAVTVHRTGLAEFLEILATDLGVKTLHCEGGGSLIRALAELDAIDDFHVTLAGHILFGGRDARTATGIPGGFLPKSTVFRLTHFDPRPELGECFATFSRVEADY
jgi:riboflavin biosynthesis pyrimidine reductase